MHRLSLKDTPHCSPGIQSDMPHTSQQDYRMGNPP